MVASSGAQVRSYPLGDSLQNMRQFIMFASLLSQIQEAYLAFNILLPSVSAGAFYHWRSATSFICQ